MGGQQVTVVNTSPSRERERVPSTCPSVTGASTGLSRSSVRSREAGSVPLGSNSSTSAAGWTDTWSTLDSATLTSFTSSASSSTV